MRGGIFKDLVIHVFVLFDGSLFSPDFVYLLMSLISLKIPPLFIPAFIILATDGPFIQSFSRKIGCSFIINPKFSNIAFS